MFAKAVLVARAFVCFCLWGIIACPILLSGCGQDDDAAKSWLKGGNSDPAASLTIKADGVSRTLEEASCISQFNAMIASGVPVRRGIVMKGRIGEANIQLKSGKQFTYICYVSDKALFLMEGNDDDSPAVIATFLPADCGTELFRKLTGAR
jgi:hypothetical protein